MSSPAALGLSPSALQTLLVIAGVSCCVAMSMPQVHLVAYCADLGYGAGARRADAVADAGMRHREPPHVRLHLRSHRRPAHAAASGSALQGLSLLLFLPFDGLVSLYLISALFGLFQGGIVPSYAIIVREYFPAREAGARVGVVITATLFGMALGGWMSGAIFDLTGSYKAAFVNGILWNLVNVSIAAWLLRRSLWRPALA